MIGRLLILGTVVALGNCLIRPLNDDVTDLTNAVSRFSQGLYKMLAVNQPIAIYSPFSAHAALSMAYLGARENTADQMEAALQLANVSDPHGDYQVVNEQLNNAQSVKILIANGLWVNPSFAIEQRYQDDVALLYNGEVDHLNFKDPGGAEAPINRWAANKTENKITSILQPGTLSGATAVVLVNSVFFNGTWSSAFKKESTYKGDFNRLGGAKVQVDFMNQIRRFGLKKSFLNSVDIIRLPFVNRRFAFYIALPKTLADLQKLESFIAGDLFDAENFFTGFKEMFVNMTIPKFSITSTMRLNDALISLGMRDAFSGAANFSGITPSSVSISSVVQKALIEVQETGTIAAAVTAVVIERTSANIVPPDAHVFRADRPFLFFLRDDRLKLILFQGKLSDPSVKNVQIPAKT